MSFATKQVADRPDVIAPDGSEVRILCATGRGSMAHFTLAPGAVANAIAHRTIDEVWYVVAGRGRMWRRLGSAEAVVDLRPGLSLTIPQGTRFQFRADGDARPAVCAGMVGARAGGGAVIPSIPRLPLALLGSLGMTA